MSISKIKTGSITTDAITEAKVADGAIENEHINSNVITGHTELAEAAAGTDILLVYDASAGTLKKIQASNVGLQAPSVTSVSPTSVTSGDGTGNYTFTITGTGFIASAVPTLITNGGASVSFDSFTIDSNTQITGVIAKSSLSNANEPYDVKVTTAGALNATLENQINIDASPTFNTASGSVGFFVEQSTISTIDIEAYDPESASNVTFEIQSGSLPAGLTASTVNENGVSKYRITGTLTTDVASLTTTNFTLRASDANSNTSSRAFSISEVPSATVSFTSSGTFSVPTGVTSADVLVIAGGGGGGADNGGGGGAGGLIFMPGYPLTPGGTVTVTVGCGGTGAPQPDQRIATPAQDSVFGDLTAKGGGYGSGGVIPCASDGGGPGGSGGGGSGHGTGASGSFNYGGPAIQPTQPGNSGSYGFGNNGGNGERAPSPSASRRAGGGGGGSGGNGGNASAVSGIGGCAGNGKAYTIADGTTPVYYAAGGAGGAEIGGGAAGCAGGVGANCSATANRGSGGGGGDNNSGAGNGGKGIVIVAY